MNWIEVARVENLSPGLHLFGEGRNRFVLALIDGNLSAFDPICPHAGGPMHLAETDGTVLSCPLHAWRFDLARNGCELHGYRPLRTYPVQVKNGLVYVERPAADVGPAAVSGSAN